MKNWPQKGSYNIKLANIKQEVTPPWQESRKPSTTVTKISIFDFAGDLDPPLETRLWKNHSATLKIFYLQLCWGFKHQICSAGKPSSDEFIEHSSTVVSDVIITWLWRRKRLSRHRLLVLFLLPDRILDGLAKVIFHYLSNCCFERVWPGSELTIWYDVCFQSMPFRN